MQRAGHTFSRCSPPDDGHTINLSSACRSHSLPAALPVLSRGRIQRSTFMHGLSTPYFHERTHPPTAPAYPTLFLAVWSAHQLVLCGSGNREIQWTLEYAAVHRRAISSARYEVAAAIRAFAYMTSMAWLQVRGAERNGRPRGCPRPLCTSGGTSQTALDGFDHVVAPVFPL